MPLHPEYQAMLKQAAELGGPSLTEMPVSAAREMMRVSQPPRPDIEVGNVVDTKITGNDGPIAVRVYQPASSGPHPIVFMMHGGGWVIGDLDTADAQSRCVCRGVDALVISIDYRLAPESMFPAAPEDCYSVIAAYEQLAQEFNGDSNRVAVAGDSAGGNLAAVVSQLVRDRGGPEIMLQLLVYPVIDGTGRVYPSFEENAEGYMLTSGLMDWFWDSYCDASERDDPRSSPICARDLSGLPSACIMTAEFDPLRDEGEAYGEALGSAGVEVEVTRYPGLIHGFFAHSLVLSCARQPMSDACEALKVAFSK